MQFKTTILLSVLAAVSTTTFAAPVNSHGSALTHHEENLDTPHRHYARDFGEVQEIEARSPSPDEQELEARSPFKILAPGSTGSRFSNRYGWAAANPIRALIHSQGPKAGTRQNFINTVRQRKTRFARGLPENVQEPEAGFKIKPLESSSSRSNAFVRYSAAVLRAHKPQLNKGGPLSKARLSASRALYARSIPEDIQEVEARSPSYELDDIDA